MAFDSVDAIGGAKHGYRPESAAAREDGEALAELDALKKGEE